MGFMSDGALEFLRGTRILQEGVEYTVDWCPTASLIVEYTV